MVPVPTGLTQRSRHGWLRSALLLALGAACLIRSVHAAETQDWDARLGSPFPRRTRAIIGSDTAKVIVIEFSSFNCTHCRSFQQQVFPELRRQYIDTGKVQWVAINASNEDSDRTSPVFLAAQAALQGGHYWDLVDQFYDVGVRPPAYFAQLLKGNEGPQGLPLAQSLEGPSVRAAIDADYSEYRAIGIRGTPTFLIRKQNADGRWTRSILEDTQPLDYFRRVLDSLVNEGGA